MKVLKGSKKYMIVLIILSCIYSYFSLQIAVYISYAIDGLLFHNRNQIPSYLSQIIKGDTIKGLLVLGVIMISINAIIAIVGYIRQRVTTLFSLKISSTIKKNLYAHILNLKYQSYQSYSKVEMLQRANDDAQEYANFYKVQFNLMLDIISLSFFVITQSIVFSISITIYLIITITIMILFAFWYYRNMMLVLEKVIVKKKKMLGAIIDNVNQFKFTRIYNRQKAEVQKYKKLNKDYTEEDIRLVKLILFYEIISEHITYLKSPIIYLLGGISIMKGTMTMRYINCFVVICH
ncbi:MAG: ABC transporter ATP-binding protein [Clostridia bacterium]|nr:ABC transporter ATP-binding protein [Clostridia bacterium]